MKLPTAFLIAIVSLSNFANGKVADEITWIVQGYSFFAKLPCSNCPFLYQDTSQGQDTLWTTRTDDNALLLNISLPFTTPIITLNNQPIWPSTDNNLPLVHATQVVLDLSASDLANAISSNQLEASHETGSSNLGGIFGLSYKQSLRPLKDSAAVVFIFDIIELYSDLTSPATKFKLEDPEQKVLEMVLLQRPVLSALDAVAFEIVRVDLVPRTQTSISTFAADFLQQTMHFTHYDAHGRKGTPSHLISWYGTALGDWLDSSVWALFLFLFGIIGFFVVICLLVVYGCDVCSDEYESAQAGKRRDGRRRGSGSGNGRTWSEDVEMAKRFMSPEELGLLGRGKVVGVGKSD